MLYMTRSHHRERKKKKKNQRADQKNVSQENEPATENDCVRAKVIINVSMSKIDRVNTRAPFEKKNEALSSFYRFFVLCECVLCWVSSLVVFTYLSIYFRAGNDLSSFINDVLDIMR